MAATQQWIDLIDPSEEELRKHLPSSIRPTALRALLDNFWNDLLLHQTNFIFCKNRLVHLDQVKPTKVVDYHCTGSDLR